MYIIIIYVKTTEEGETVKEYKTLKEISDELIYFICFIYFIILFNYFNMTFMGSFTSNLVFR